MPLPFLEVPVLFLYIHHPLPVLLQLLGLLGRSKLRGNALGSRLGQTLAKVGCLDLVELLGSSGHSFLVVSGNEFVPCDFLVDVRFDLAVRAQVHRHVSLPIRCKALVALISGWLCILGPRARCCRRPSSPDSFFGHGQFTLVSEVHRAQILAVSSTEPLLCRLEVHRALRRNRWLSFAIERLIVVCQ